MSTTCSKCGNDSIEGDIFCNNCGQRLVPLGGPNLGEEPKRETIFDIPRDDLPPFLREMGGPGAKSEPSLPEARLVVRVGENLGAEFTLDKPESLIGRTPESDVFINDRLVSRRHAKISWAAGRYTVEDLNSANGTFVNGLRLAEPTLLHPKDVVQVGSTTLLFQMEESALNLVPDFGTMIVPNEMEQPEAPPSVDLPAEEPVVEHMPEDEAQAESAATEQLVLDEPEQDEAPSEVAEAEPEVTTAVAESPAAAEEVEEIASEPEEMPEEMEYEVSAQEVQEAVADTADLAVRLRDALGEAVGRTGQLTELAENISQSITAEWQQATSLLEQLEETRSRMDDRERSLTESLEIKEQQETELASLRKELGEAEAERELIDRDLAGVTDLLKRLTGRVSIYAQQTNLFELASLVDDVVSNPRDIDYASALTRRASSLAELLKVWEEIMAGLDEVSGVIGRLKVG